MLINHYTLKYRKQKGLPLDMPLKNKPKIVKDKLGFTSDEQLALCEKCGISHTLYTRRKEKGWTLEEIIQTPKGDLRFKYQVLNDILRNKQAVSSNKHSSKGLNCMNLGNLKNKTNFDYKYLKLAHLNMANTLYQDEEGRVKDNKED